MTILPEGNPIWSRVPSIEQYGGHLEKRDYLDIGVVNSKTDVSARQLTRMTADLAAVARVAPLLRMRITVQVGSISVDWCSLAWGADATYSGATAIGPSPAYPTVSLEDNDLVIQMPTSATDDYGVERVVVPREAIVTSGAEWDGEDISSGRIVLNTWVAFTPVMLEVY